MHPLYGHKEDTNLTEGYTLIIEMVFLFLTARAFFQTPHISSTFWHCVFREEKFIYQGVGTGVNTRDKTWADMVIKDVIKTLLWNLNSTCNYCVDLLWALGSKKDTSLLIFQYLNFWIVFSDHFDWLLVN